MRRHKVHVNISLNAKFQTFILFPCEIIKICSILGYFRPTLYHVTSHVGSNLVVTTQFPTPELV